jgi:hypothetical protein
MLAGAGVDTMTIARQLIYFGGKAQFGDGKPIVLLPQLGSNLPFVLLSNWLRGLGYRPVTTGISVNLDDQSTANLIRVTTERIGRKAVLVTPASGVRFASAIAEAHKDRVSDIVVLDSSRRLDLPLGVHAHFILFDWSLLFSMTSLAEVLRNIRIELIEGPNTLAQGYPAPPHSELSAEREQK